MNAKLKVIFGFRNGGQNEIYCDEITVKRNNLTGELAGYEIKDMSQVSNPLYIKMSEVIYVITSQEDGDNNG